MTRKTYDILCAVLGHLKDDDFGICSNIRISVLFADVTSDFFLEGVWLYYRSSVNEIFYYTGVPCDKFYVYSSYPDEYVYLYKLD